MCDINCYIQDTKMLGDVNIHLKLFSYTVYKDHLFIEVEQLGKEEAEKILTSAKLYPEESFTLILDNNVFYGCQGLAFEPHENPNVTLFYDITFESKQAGIY